MSFLPASSWTPNIHPTLIPGGPKDHGPVPPESKGGRGSRLGPWKAGGTPPTREAAHCQGSAGTKGQGVEVWIPLWFCGVIKD
jgi:hypothetical protein